MRDPYTAGKAPRQRLYIAVAAALAALPAAWLGVQRFRAPKTSGSEAAKNPDPFLPSTCDPANSQLATVPRVVHSEWPRHLANLTELDSSAWVTVSRDLLELGLTQRAGQLQRIAHALANDHIALAYYRLLESVALHTHECSGDCTGRGLNAEPACLAPFISEEALLQASFWEAVLALSEISNGTLVTRNLSDYAAAHLGDAVHPGPALREFLVPPESVKELLDCISHASRHGQGLLGMILGVALPRWNAIRPLCYDLLLSSELNSSSRLSTIEAIGDALGQADLSWLAKCLLEEANGPICRRIVSRMKRISPTGWIAECSEALLVSSLLTRCEFATMTGGFDAVEFENVNPLLGRLFHGAGRALKIAILGSFLAHEECESGVAVVNSILSDTDSALVVEGIRTIGAKQSNEKYRALLKELCVNHENAEVRDVAQSVLGQVDGFK